MKKLRSLISVAALLAMLVTCLTPFIVSSADTGYTPTDAYVLYYKKYSKGNFICEHVTPYKTNLSYIVAEEPYEEMTGTISLYNTLNNNEVFETYCVDQYTGVKGGNYYKRINLEDSVYFSDETAALLRTIVHKGYPMTSVDELAQAAGVEGLQLGEALHATQLAIWQTSYGDVFSINEPVSSLNEYWKRYVAHYQEEYLDELENYAKVTDLKVINEHVTAVYDYLMSLGPTAPTSVAISNGSFVNWSDSPVLEKNADGTYNVTVQATVNVQITNADSVTLSAVLGDGAYYASTSVTNGVSSHTITIENVPADMIGEDLKLALDGSQTVSDVFMFTVKGKRDASQALIGFNSDTLPVHAEVTLDEERIIKIHKSGKGIGLEGIQFDIYFICDRDEYLSGNIDLPKAKDYPYETLGSYGDYSIVTDSNGYGEFSLTKNNMPDGVYLIVEKEHPAIVEPVDPFYVIVPATTEDGSELVYDIDIYPKNEIRGDIDIEKDVIFLGNNSATVDAYKNHTWIISATIPVDIGIGKKYIITDTLDYRLDYIGNVRVTVESTDGSQTTAILTEGSDYKLTVTDNDSLSEGYPVDSFEVSLTPTGMAKVAAAAPDVDDYRVRVYFDAQINANAQLGIQIPNKALIYYKNSVGVEFDDESDEPEVHTGGIRLIKKDANDSTKVLESAVFEIYRAATEEEVADENITKHTLEGLSTPMILVEFFDNKTLTGNKVTSATSGADGEAVFYGLAYGSYYISETKAPNGYNLLSKPVHVVITEDSHLDDNKITVLNTSGVLLPSTGGGGTVWFIVIGAVLMLGAYVGFVVRLRMRSR